MNERKLLYFAWCIGSLFTPCPAWAEYNSSDFFKDCDSAVAIARGEKNRAGELSGALHCLGFVEAAATGMIRSHELYSFLFPNLKDSDLRTETIGKRYVATALLAGFDVCIPEKTSIQILTMLVVKYINENPTSLSSSAWSITNYALAGAYTCRYGSAESK